MIPTNISVGRQQILFVFMVFVYIIYIRFNLTFKNNRIKIRNIIDLLDLYLYG